MHIAPNYFYAWPGNPLFFKANPLISTAISPASGRATECIMFAAGKFSSMMFWTGVAGAEHPDAMSVIDADSGAGCPAPGVTAGESAGSTCQDDRHIYGSVLTCYRGALVDEGRVRRVRAPGVGATPGLLALCRRVTEER